jgi:hypothetical protein
MFDAAAAVKERQVDCINAAVTGSCTHSRLLVIHSY